ncbi:MAG: cell volume regulation protein A, partial [Saprospiraceae bacterium]
LLSGMIVQPGSDAHASGLGSFALSFLLIMAIALISSYMIVLIFQRISSSAKLFLLIATLLLVYSVGVLMHLSALIIILIFGLVIANMDLFFVGPLKKWLDKKKAHDIYHGLHVITLETAFVIRTFFFVVFGITIVFSSLSSLSVLGVSILCIAVIYIIRYLLLRASLGSDIHPQIFIAPRGLITILLFYKIPEYLETENFSQGILLFVIIGTSIIMTISLIMNKNRANKAIKGVQSVDISETKWKVPDLKPKTDS